MGRLLQYFNSQEKGKSHIVTGNIPNLKHSMSLSSRLEDTHLKMLAGLSLYVGLQKTNSHFKL